MVDDKTFLKIVAVILIMVAIVTMAQTDANNPLSEIGIPIDANSFNVFSLGNAAPQIAPMTSPYDQPAGEEYCWISWFCPDLGFTDVALAIHNGVTVFVNLWVTIANGILWVGTAIVLLFVNFFTVFHFYGWGVFQGHVFLLIFAVLLESTLAGFGALWLIAKVTGGIPFVGGV